MKVFRVTAEQLSFRKASELLHISQPAVSQQIHALEEEAGVRLFDRTGKHTSLTEAGTVLLKYARKAAQTMEEATEALASLKGEVSGKLRLGASTTVAQYVLPRILGAFQRHHPRVQLSVISGNTEQIVEALAAGRIELGIIEGPAMRRDIKTEKLLEDRMVLIVTAGHEWAEAGSIPPQALKQAQLLMREQGSGSRRVVELALKRAAVPTRHLQVAMELDSTEAIISGVEAGLGIGFVSQWAIGKEVKLGTVVPVRVEGLHIRRDFSFIRAAGPEPVGAAGVFRRFALAAATEPPTPPAKQPRAKAR
ncbi:MAG: LysR substrate-binding domain-containing protein [Acidobacteriaceae bacterium]